ncbi:helix-turn-helix domain-containing protein [Streptomyces sp. NPDC049837]|uniref:PucR family transcriptional regulator n=1 Tax=Streptomyces sp. NPDC049837 TaxID=3155277 RepID=UPI0034477529
MRDRITVLAGEVLRDPTLVRGAFPPRHSDVVSEDLGVWLTALTNTVPAPDLEEFFRARAAAHAAAGLRCEESILQQQACATVLVRALTNEAPAHSPERTCLAYVLKERALHTLKISTATIIERYRPPSEPSAPSQSLAAPPQPPTPSCTATRRTAPRHQTVPRWCLAATQLGHGTKAALQKFRALNPHALVAITGTNVTAFTQERPNVPELFGPYGLVPIEEGDTMRAARRAALAAVIARHYGVRVDTGQALPLIAALDMAPEERENFVISCLGPLYTNLRHRYLLETLSTYLAHNLCVTAAARSLYVHRHTLTYRLRSIESLTGIDLSNPFDRMRAELALILSRTSGWSVPRERTG